MTSLLAASFFGGVVVKSPLSTSSPRLHREHLMHTFARTTPYALSILLTLFVVTSSACERQVTKDTDVAEQKETTTASETSPADTAPAETTEQAASNEGEETREEDDEEAPDTSARKTHTAKEILDSHKLVAYASEEVILFASEDDCFDEGCEVDWMKLDAKKDPRVLSRELTREQAKRYMDILSSPKSYGATPAACYVPRLAVAAYHEGASEPWAIVGVCIECATLSTAPHIKEIHDAMPEYEAGLGKGADDIRAWCKELGFKGCAKQLTHYEAMEAELEEE